MHQTLNCKPNLTTTLNTLSPLEGLLPVPADQQEEVRRFVLLLQPRHPRQSRLQGNRDCQEGQRSVDRQLDKQVLEQAAH